MQPQKAHIVELGELAKQALREVRLLIYELRPTELEEEGLVGALFRRLETVEQRAGISIRLLYIYVFGAWGLLIGLLALVIERRRP